MTKELFLKILNTIKHHRLLENKFCDVLEEMSPHESCNCFLYSDYENLCYDFFVEVYGSRDAEYIFYWTIDENFGANGSLKMRFGDLDIEINSDEELYELMEDIHNNPSKYYSNEVAKEED